LAGLSLTGLSPVAENLVVLRLAALRSEVHRLVAVLKARNSRIDLRMRRFDIGEGGIMIESDSATAEAVLQELTHRQFLPLPSTDVRFTGE
jgi:circadian clock protein KaiC